MTGIKIQPPPLPIDEIIIIEYLILVLGYLFNIIPMKRNKEILLFHLGGGVLIIVL